MGHVLVEHHVVGGPCSEADGRGQKRRPSAEPSIGGVFGDATALPQGPSSKRYSNDMMFYQNMSGAQNVGIPQLSGSNYAPTLNLSPSGDGDGGGLPLDGSMSRGAGSRLQASVE